HVRSAENRPHAAKLQPSNRFIDCPVQLGRDAITRDIPIQVEKVLHRKSGAAAVVCAKFRLAGRRAPDIVSAIFAS
ncbi:hypothetical protein, partial [Massilia genomosp. 1]|uniref:hypothetical protein n=1 Tax=Massilia genomosp. 1 TaxID=2609280 RepID=UPI001C9E9C30